jgi:tRNA(Ile)-lysidine synthase TilS/MesJ
MLLCSHCILPETFPGIKFDECGVCNHCRQEESAIAKAPEKKVEYRKRLDSLIADTKGKAPSYDAICAYSGGKDSSYTLKVLRELYDLRIIALVFDNHFISPAAWENIKAVTDGLGVDVIRFRPSWPPIRKLFVAAAQQDIFPPATLLRASSVCTGCITMVKSLTIKTALEMAIPLAAYGWSPGQAPIQAAIMKPNWNQIKQNQKSLQKAFPPEISLELSRYLIPDSYYASCKDRFPTNIHPLAFFEYDENKIKEELKGLGWKAPEDTDSNSTNCLLNAFANANHLEKHNFHPYVLEIANMVRQGVMAREEGIEKIYNSPQDPKMVAFAKEKLGL